MKIVAALAVLLAIGLWLAYRREKRLLARDFAAEAELACREPISLVVHGISIGRLNFALRQAAARAFPAIPDAELIARVRRGLTITCESCGPLSERDLNQVIVTEASFAAGGRDLLGKDADTANRASGSCPTCGHNSFTASFDPAGLKAAGG